jgi:hypothetical protein
VTQAVRRQRQPWRERRDTGAEPQQPAAASRVQRRQKPGGLPRIAADQAVARLGREQLHLEPRDLLIEDRKLGR